MGNRKRKENQKGKKRKKQKKTFCRGEEFVEREMERKGREKRKRKRKGKERKKREEFLALRLSKLDGPSTKVGARSATYVWTPKTWNFDKLHKVGTFPTRFIFSLKVI